MRQFRSQEILLKKTGPNIHFLHLTPNLNFKIFQWLSYLPEEQASRSKIQGL
jgi:hypothetical protein